MKVIFTKKSCALLWVIVLLLTSSCMAAELSTSRGWFATKGLGARAIAMGEAFCAVADDASSIYWNPAGLAAFPSSEVSTMHSNIYGVGIMHDYLVWKGRKAGLMWEGTNYEQLAGFPCREDSLTLSFATRFDLLRPVYVGVNLKGFYVNVDSADGKGTLQGAGLDFGLLSPLTNKWWLGFTVKDPVSILQGKASVDDQEWELGEPLATELNIGIAFRKDERTILTLECGDLLNNPEPRIGGERWLSNGIAFRAGWNATDSLSGGVGIKFASWTVDYTYVNAKLGANQQLAVSYSF